MRLAVPLIVAVPNKKNKKVITVLQIRPSSELEQPIKGLITLYRVYDCFAASNVDYLKALNACVGRFPLGQTRTDGRQGASLLQN